MMLMMLKKYLDILRRHRKIIPTPQPQNEKISYSTKPQMVDVSAAVIVPGFLMGESEFKPLAESLTKRGVPTVVVPLPAWHWIACCFGKKSFRPILVRVDRTVRHVTACIANNQDVVVPKLHYGGIDFCNDCFHNVYGPSADDNHDDASITQQHSASPPNICFAQFSPQRKLPSPSSTSDKEEMEYLPLSPINHDPSRVTTNIQPRIALIGHSAGGLVSRIYLSNRPYAAGRAYRGSEFIHSLVTLGTPHGNVQGPNMENIHWCNQEPPLSVRGLAIGAIGTPGHCSGSLTEGAYTFSTIPQKQNSNYHDDNDILMLDGDGLTTIESALSLKGENVEHKILQDVTHYPWSNAGIWGHLIEPELAKQHLEGKPWYGDDHIVDEWVGFIADHTNITSIK
mmetsp:Transcript_4041/g.6152  ORF Transcript_4041/g.6152 Transcript_4041/m.6152 type:complete len:397 (-) Transcript_4041:66-1256(-)